MAYLFLSFRFDRSLLGHHHFALVFEVVFDLGVPVYVSFLVRQRILKY